MQVNYASDHDCSAAGVLSGTGKSLDAWFAILDAAGGAGLGRRALGEHLIGQHALDAWWVTTLLVAYEAARGKVEKDGTPSGFNICVTKAVGAEPMKVYETLLDTAWWLGGVPARAAEGAQFDDGDGHTGVWKKLSPGKVLRFTWAGSRHAASEQVEIKLAPSGSKTSIVLNHTRLADRAAADGMRGAWARVLETLKGRCA